MVLETSKCTGCSACSVVCPTNCITMVNDKDGFLIPSIDKDKCVNCGLCQKKCPVIAMANIENTQAPNAYYYVNNDLTVLRKSSSGGAFMCLAQKVIEDGGAVFGAIYDQTFAVVTGMAENAEDLEKMQGSKYVECDPKDSYLKVKQLLEQGRLVLYTSTPCKIAGLYATLGNKDYSNLITMEFVCHGVPSVKLFQSYLSLLTKKYGKVISYNFRNKSKWNWGNWGSFEYKTKSNKLREKHFPVASDYYYSLFFKENCLRESCYQCKFASLPRVADVTVGDCWGIERKLAYKEYKNGVSVVVVNNIKGQRFFLQCAGEKTFSPLDLEWVKKNNGTLIKPTKRPDSRDTVYKDLESNDFENTAKKYVKIKRVTPYLARKIPRWAKNFAKKLLRA